MSKLSAPDGSNFTLELDATQINNISRAYVNFCTAYPNSSQEFKYALPKFLLEDYLAKIEQQSANRPDLELINTIVGELRKTRILGNISIQEKVSCAKQLLDYVNNVNLNAEEAINDDILDKYRNLFRIRFNQQVTKFNNGIRKPKITEKILTSKISNVDTQEALNMHIVQNLERNTFVYYAPADDNRTHLLYYINLDSVVENPIDLSGLSRDDLSNLAESIQNDNFPKFKSILTENGMFPKQLQHVQQAYDESNSYTTQKFKARLGAVAAIIPSQNAKIGDTQRAISRRQAYLNGRVDTIRDVAETCNSLAPQLGFKSQPKAVIDLEIWSGKIGPEGNPVLNEKQNDLYILHLNAQGRPQDLYYVYKKNRIAITRKVELDDENLTNLTKDLVHICSDVNIGKYTPSVEAAILKTHYKSAKVENGVIRQVDIGSDLLNFIVEKTGYLPESLTQSKYSEMISLRRQVDAGIEEINNNNIPKQIKPKLVDILGTVGRISDLPANYFNDSDSIVPRYRCKEIVDNLVRCAREPNPSNLEYLRNSYKLYKVNLRHQTDTQLKQKGPNNPRFYFDEDNNEIAYVDQFNNVHRSSFAREYAKGFNPVKLVNLLAKKTKQNDHYELDSEEVFKYITAKVQDKNEFKMHTANEEIEEIIAEEIVTTTNTLKQLALAALYIGVLMLLVFVPGFSLILFIAASVALQMFAPVLIDSIGLKAYNEVLKNFGVAFALVAFATLLAFIPGANFLSLVPAAGAMLYVNIAISSLAAAYKVGSAFSSIRKNPEINPAGRELLSLKEQIKNLTASNNQDDEEDDDQQQQKLQVCP